MKTLIFKNFDNSLYSHIKVDAHGTIPEFQAAGFDTRFTDMQIENISDAAIVAGLKNLQVEDRWQDAIALAQSISGIGMYVLDQNEPNIAAVAQVEDALITGTAASTANVVINGTNYLMTFNTTLETTVDDWITAHAANVLSATGVVVTAPVNGTINAVSGGSEFSIEVVNATGDMAGAITNTTLYQPGSGVVTIVSPNHA